MCDVWYEWKSVVGFYPLNTTQIFKFWTVQILPKQTIETSLLSYNLPQDSDDPPTRSNIGSNHIEEEATWEQDDYIRTEFPDLLVPSFL